MHLLQEAGDAVKQMSLRLDELAATKETALQQWTIHAEEKEKQTAVRFRDLACDQCKQDLS